MRPGLSRQEKQEAAESERIAAAAAAAALAAAKANWLAAAEAADEEVTALKRTRAELGGAVDGMRGRLAVETEVRVSAKGCGNTVRATGVSPTTHRDASNDDDAPTHNSCCCCRCCCCCLLQLLMRRHVYAIPAALAGWLRSQLAVAGAVRRCVCL